MIRIRTLKGKEKGKMRMRSTTETGKGEKMDNLMAQRKIQIMII